MEAWGGSQPQLIHRPQAGSRGVPAQRWKVEQVRVLIVEDEPAIADALFRGFAAEGIVSDVAADGARGLGQALAMEYDVVVLDLRLPVLSGYEVCRRLRKAGSAVPVLVLTAKDGEYDEVDALDFGADDFLSKPFSFAVLLAHLRALLRRSSPQRSPMLTAGDLVLDPAARQVWRDRTEIHLTAREFGLLEFLVRHRGQAVSRAQIAEHVWASGLGPDSNVVEVYVGYLRRKIDDPFGTRSIVTVRGIGYRLAGGPGVDRGTA